MNLVGYKVLKIDCVELLARWKERFNGNSVNRSIQYYAGFDVLYSFIGHILISSSNFSLFYYVNLR